MAEKDDKVLLALLTVQMKGGQSVQATEEPIKSVSKFLKEAEERGLLAKKKIKIPAIKKTGQPTTKNVDAYDLTEEGRAYLKQQGDPQSVAVAVNASFLQSLQEAIEADRQKIHQEVKEALADKGKGKKGDTVQKELAGLTKKLEDLARRLEQLEQLAQPDDDEEIILARIDRGFEAIASRLDQALRTLPAATAPTDQNGSARSEPREREKEQPPPTPPARTTAKDLEAILHEAYEDLCLLTRYQDGAVALPELFDTVKKHVPDLTLKRFHQKLLELEEKGKIQLHIWNEVREAEEPEKAIYRNDALYYILLWKKP